MSTHAADSSRCRLHETEFKRCDERAHLEEITSSLWISPLRSSPAAQDDLGLGIGLCISATAETHCEQQESMWEHHFHMVCREADSQEDIASLANTARIQRLTLGTALASASANHQPDIGQVWHCTDSSPQDNVSAARCSSAPGHA